MTDPSQHPLRQPNLRRFLLGAVPSDLTYVLGSMAIGWDLYERTHSAYVLGFVGVVQFLPILLLALPAGHAADRYDRRRILILAVALHALASLGLAFVSGTGAALPWYFACLLLNGVARSLWAPAQSAFFPALVPDEVLPSSLTWQNATGQAMALLGPILGGWLLAQWHEAWLLYACAAAGSIWLIGCLSFIRLPRPQTEPESFDWQDLLQGLRFMARSELLLAAITLDMFAVLLGGATALLPIFAKDVLRVGPAGLGWLMTAGALGAAVTSAVLTQFPPIRRNGPVLLAMVAGFGVATIGFGLARDPVVAFAMLFLTGAFDAVSMVIRQNMSTLLTPDGLRGRVEAIQHIFIGTSNELGGFESGLTAGLWGPVRAVVLGGIGTIAVVLLVAWRSPSLRRLGAIHPVPLAPTESGGPVTSPLA